MECAFAYCKKNGLNVDGVLSEGGCQYGYEIRGYEDMGTHIVTTFRCLVCWDGTIEVYEY